MNTPFKKRENPLSLGSKAAPAPTPVVAQVNDRVKYTATMEVSLRRKIKIYCATNGKMFSEFIEDACREKLLREGIK